jgi:predicted transcriptional regulator
MNRLRELELRVEDLQRERKALDMEFTELYDKVSHQMSRMAKRYRTADKLNGTTSPDEVEADQYAHLDPISKSIMLRRAGLGGQK